MIEMKTFNGYEVVDAKARQDIANIHTPTKVSELENDSNYATQGFVNQKIEDAELDSYFLDFSKATDTAQAATERMVKFAEHLAARVAGADPDACAYIRDTHDNIYYPAMVQYKWENGTLTINLVKVGSNLNTIAMGSETTWDTVRISGNTEKGWTYQLLSSSSFTFASKEYVDDAIANIDIPAEYITETELTNKGYLTEHQSLANYYTKAETDELISNINECDTYFFDPESYPWSNDERVNPNYAPDDLAEFAQRFLNGEGVNLYIAFKDVSGGIRWLTAEILTNTSGGVLIARNISWSDFNREALVTTYQVNFNDTDNTWRVHKKLSTTHDFRYATTDYVDTAIQTALEALEQRIAALEGK